MMGCKITDCVDKVQQANPVRYVDDEDPPVMIIHGMSDTTVPYVQGLLLYMALKEACRDAVLIGEPNAPHGRNEQMVENPQMQQGAILQAWPSELHGGLAPADDFRRSRPTRVLDALSHQADERTRFLRLEATTAHCRNTSLYAPRWC